MMKGYDFVSNHKRRYLWGLHAKLNEERCPICGRARDIPESQRRYVELEQGSFVSNILWAQDIYVTQELKTALKEGEFTGIDFEEAVIVKDSRPSSDKRKLPFEAIPSFYQVKFIACARLHSDFFKLYEPQLCYGCGRFTAGRRGDKPYILNASYLPGTDFFRLEEYRFPKFCTERGKEFLEKYPNTYCLFTSCELRD